MQKTKTRRDYRLLVIVATLSVLSATVSVAQRNTNDPSQGPTQSPATSPVVATTGDVAGEGVVKEVNLVDRTITVNTKGSTLVFAITGNTEIQKLTVTPISQLKLGDDVSFASYEASEKIWYFVDKFDVSSQNPLELTSGGESYEAKDLIVMRTPLVVPMENAQAKTNPSASRVVGTTTVYQGRFKDGYPGQKFKVVLKITEPNDLTMTRVISLGIDQIKPNQKMLFEASKSATGALDLVGAKLFD